MAGLVAHYQQVSQEEARRGDALKSNASSLLKRSRVVGRVSQQDNDVIGLRMHLRLSEHLSDLTPLCMQYSFHKPSQMLSKSQGIAAVQDRAYEHTHTHTHTLSLSLSLSHSLTHTHAYLCCVTRNKRFDAVKNEWVEITSTTVDLVKVMILYLHT